MGQCSVESSADPRARRRQLQGEIVRSAADNRNLHDVRKPPPLPPVLTAAKAGSPGSRTRLFPALGTGVAAQPTHLRIFASSREPVAERCISATPGYDEGLSQPEWRGRPRRRAVFVGTSTSRQHAREDVMAEQDTGGAAAVAEQDFEYPIKIEDAGPGEKKVSVEIPAERIRSELQRQFKELRSQAAIPGFRPGHAPQKLIEKRFDKDVKDQVRGSLIRESYEQAIEKHKLQVLGEPDFGRDQKLDLPDDGSLSYTFSVEVQPEFTLPELSGVKVRKPKIDIKDENVDQAMQNLREQQGALVPVEDRGVQPKDFLFADVYVKVDGNVVAQQHGAQVVARPGRIGGIQIDDLDKQLEGLKTGETRTLKVSIPDTHPNEAIKGKVVEIGVELKDLKRLELAEVTPEFLADLGFENEQELRDALKEQMVEKINYDVQQNLREQIHKYLLDNTKVELPAKLSDRQADRVVSRRATDLLMRGIPRERLEANLEALRGGAKEEGIRELKLFFILAKIAADQNTDVDEAELNGRIAMLAAQGGQRPEKLKYAMAKDGSLQNLYVQLREQKAIDRILEAANVEEFEVKPGEEAAATGEQPAA
jgi:trigger factor